MATTTKPRVVTRTRLHPTTRNHPPKITQLSILDATVVNFAPCSAVWLYDDPARGPLASSALPQKLQQALETTLDDYHHFAGRLEWAAESPSDTEARSSPPRFGRPVVVYGTDDDPGVEFVVAEDDRLLGQLTPSREERRDTQRVWRATGFPQHELLPVTNLALSGLVVDKERPAAAIQVTTFRCGGFSVGMSLTHCLGDAVCLSQFVHRWAANTEWLVGQVGGQAIPPRSLSTPVFQPDLLDQHASVGSIGEPDAGKIQTARALPMQRFDWWAFDAPGYPAWAKDTTLKAMPPASQLSSIQLSPSTHPPWPTWDPSLSVDHVQIRFTADEIARFKATADQSLPESHSCLRVSRTDATLAYAWGLVNRARQLQNSHDPVYLNVTLGVRQRLQPPLPNGFVGSPIMLAYVSKSGKEASAAAIGTVAGAIRQTVSQFTSDAVSCYLHDAAHEISPQRLWQGFLGSRHMIVTSWVGVRAYEVDFCGTGILPRYVQGVMPRMDGIMQLLDVHDTGDVDVGICLERGAMGRLLDELTAE